MMEVSCIKDENILVTRIIVQLEILCIIVQLEIL